MRPAIRSAVTASAAGEGVGANGSARSARASFWKRQLRQWHWISSALCLALVMLFAVTGITLNHAGFFESEGVSELNEFELPPAVVEQLAEIETEAPLSDDLASAIRESTGVDLSGHLARNEYGEMVFDLARPGVDGNLVLDLNEGRAYHEEIDRGTVAMLNDLHKGRNAGPVWSLLIDLAAVCFIIFALTGFGLLWLQARMQPSTWPLTSFGAVLPVIAYLLFVHL
ncbi:PepSY-associated TM helix domain-containing protein [Alteraurantiacibacter aquimixticola]|uniref:Peptidase n=1 Tax=Alteraurantiacibacter aquimixticola TaxID=2489173 RepID=A0A4V4U8X4_9SPHN|nr:PepSY-associated TM helix domain-containing protein [Alteraurantiacibacter aquimixticola]TIX51687.1 hypothetical protein E5222_04350 [Alteraurantiacibacter aquimixticola]